MESIRADWKVDFMSIGFCRLTKNFNLLKRIHIQKASELIQRLEPIEAACFLNTSYKTLAYIVSRLDNEFDLIRLDCGWMYVCMLVCMLWYSSCCCCVNTVSDQLTEAFVAYLVHPGDDSIIGREVNFDVEKCSYIFVRRVFLKKKNNISSET